MKSTSAGVVKIASLKRHSSKQEVSTGESDETNNNNHTFLQQGPLSDSPDSGHLSKKARYNSNARQEEEEESIISSEEDQQQQQATTPSLQGRPVESVVVLPASSSSTNGGEDSDQKQQPQWILYRRYTSTLTEFSEDDRENDGMLSDDDDDNKNNNMLEDDDTPMSWDGGDSENATTRHRNSSAKRSLSRENPSEASAFLWEPDDDFDIQSSQAVKDGIPGKLNVSQSISSTIEDSAPSTPSLNKDSLMVTTLENLTDRVGTWSLTNFRRLNQRGSSLDLAQERSEAHRKVKRFLLRNNGFRRSSSMEGNAGSGSEDAAYSVSSSEPPNGSSDS